MQNLPLRRNDGFKCIVMNYEKTNSYPMTSAIAVDI